MAIYTKDNVELYEVLARERKRQGKTLKQVASGVYSLAMMKRIETGERFPRKLEGERLLARLGVSKKGRAVYLSCREYEQWKIRQDIVRSVEDRNAMKLEVQLAEYEQAVGRTNLEKQFLEAMRFMLLQMKGAPEDELRKTIEQAVSYTIPDREAAFRGAFLLAEQERMLLQEYTRLNELKEDIYVAKGEYVEEMIMCWERFCELYQEPECYCINDVIRTYRMQLGMSRRKLAEGICSEKTIERLENYGTTVQMYVVKRLFERLGVENCVFVQFL